MALKNFVCTAITFLYMGNALAAPVISDHSVVLNILNLLYGIPSL